MMGKNMREAIRRHERAYDEVVRIDEERDLPTIRNILQKATPLPPEEVPLQLDGVRWWGWSQG